MNKGIEILKAWSNLVAGSPEMKALAKQRMKVCDGCPNKVKQLGVDVCGLCSCPLIAKTHSPLNSCDEKRWKE